MYILGCLRPVSKYMGKCARVSKRYYCIGKLITLSYIVLTIHHVTY